MLVDSGVLAFKMLKRVLDSQVSTIEISSCALAPYRRALHGFAPFNMEKVDSVARFIMRKGAQIATGHKVLVPVLCHKPLLSRVKIVHGLRD